ncbi:MAG: M15 family metallopeptidase [Acidobacteriota bacterium]|nr:M15 family metallopeptidase [Acidobacteriota bacterium]
MVELRQLGDSLIVDGRLGWGRELTPVQGGIRVRHTIFPSFALPKPKPAPDEWNGLIGEYGRDFATIYILEKDARLNALVHWFDYIPLRKISRNVYEFPPSGLYDGEHVFFTRDAQGVATEVRLGSVVLPRRKLGGTEGPFFHIHPVKPVDVLRREALLAKPPAETGDFLKPDLVDVTTLDPKIKLDIRYATNRDFLGTPVYTEAKAFMQRPAAEALARVARKLENQGYGLLIHDAYRPWYVTKIFWDATPPDKHRFVADPGEGSRHNRGCAVDLTLYNLATGQQVPMTGHYDEMTERSYPFYPGGTSLERWDRNLLRRAMESEGFTVYEFEWWHFDYKDWRRYPILNLTFEQLSSDAPGKSFQ